MPQVKLLLVEDEVIISLDITRILQSLGYEVLATVPTAEEAISLAQTLRPNLVLMDIILKGDLDGIEAAKIIRRTTGIPVVYLTGNADTHTVRRARESGPYGYVLKPVTTQSLFSTIDTALRRFELEDQIQKQNEELAMLNEELQSTNEELLETQRELEKRNRDLSESEEKFRLVVENAPDAIFVQTEGRFTYVNDSALKLFGADSPEQLVGKPVLERFHPDVQEIVKKRIYLLNEEGAAVPRIDEVYLKLDGTPVDVEVSAVPFKLSGKNGSLVFVRDVTERKLADKVLHDSLKEKEFLLQEIHHRVKNNLQIIVSLLNLQFMNVNDPAITSHISEMKSRIRSMALIHERLYRSSDFAQIDLEPYINELVRDLAAGYFTPRKDIRFTIQTNDLCLSIDQAIPCGLILSELVTNALKYAFPDPCPIQPEIRIATCRTQDFIELTISDNGCGMPESLDPLCAESLGLSLVSTLVKQLDGILDITRRNGTSFRIRFKG